MPILMSVSKAAVSDKHIFPIWRHECDELAFDVTDDVIKGIGMADFLCVTLWYNLLESLYFFVGKTLYLYFPGYIMT